MWEGIKCVRATEGATGNTRRLKKGEGGGGVSVEGGRVIEETEPYGRGSKKRKRMGVWGRGAEEAWLMVWDYGSPQAYHSLPTGGITSPEEVGP